MGIKTVIIKNFKKLRDVELSFGDKTIIVGDNEEGKSTILEAIHLAFTGRFRGRPLRGQISESLFNKDAVREYIESLSSAEKKDLPKVSVEVYLENVDPELKGNNNSRGDDSEGFCFEISLPNENRGYYQELIKNGELNSLPVELYTYKWTTFARHSFYSSAKFLKLKTVIINGDNFCGSRTSVIRYLDDVLEDKDKNSVLGEMRAVQQHFLGSPTIKDLNDRIKTAGRLGSIEIGGRDFVADDWDTFVTPKEGEVPLEFFGDGHQRMIKTLLALIDAAKKSTIILIEEPECHLSFSKLCELLNTIDDSAGGNQVIITTHSSFVSNRLNLTNLLLFKNGKSLCFNDLDPSTAAFFKKRANYDTLRLILAGKTFLVEGDSDDLVLQKAFFDKNGSYPFESGIDVITCGLAYGRFLEIAKKLDAKIAVITDNDGKPDALDKKFEAYSSFSNIGGFYSKHVSKEDYGEKFNANTLEPEMLRANSLSLLNKVLGQEFADEKALIQYMESNKTETAMKIYDYVGKDLKYPDYIQNAIEFMK